MSFQVSPITAEVAMGFGFGLLVLDVVMWRVVVGMFDRGRLITGARSQSAHTSGGGSPPGQVRHVPRVGGTDRGRGDT